MCDSLVQEDAQGRQESFDSSISALWQQWGQMCLRTKIQPGKNTVIDVSTPWAHMEKETGTPHAALQTSMPETKLTSKKRASEWGEILY